MIVGIFGETQMGKTTLLKRLVRSKRMHRVIIIDPLGKLGHLGVCPSSLAEFKRYWKQQRNGNWKLVLQPGRIDDTKPARQVLDPFIAVAMKAAKQGVPRFWVVVDEVDRLGKIDAEIRAVADYGGNYGISLVFVLRRPACVDRTLTAEASALYVFRTTEGVDLDYFKGLFGRDALQRLPRLPLYHALRWTGVGKPVDLVTVDPTGASESHAAPGAAPKGVPPSTPAEEAAAAPAAAPGEAPLHPSDCVVMGLKDLAGRFGYQSPQKFRKAILDSGRIAYRRLSHRSFMVRASDLPAGNGGN